MWVGRLDVPADTRRRLETTLAPCERARAASFASAPLRDRFVVARGLLRAVLARYAAEGDRRSLVLLEEPGGKPRLACDTVRFSLSRSDDLALIAVSRDHELGVDVERVRDDVDMLAVAEQFFAPGETAGLRAVAEAGRASAFFELWTRKEAYLKGTGDGIIRGLDTAPAPTWLVRQLDVSPGYAGALAVQRCGAADACAITVQVSPVEAR